MELWAIDPQTSELVFFQGTGDFLEDTLTINTFFNTRSLTKSQEEDMNTVESLRKNNIKWEGKQVEIANRIQTEWESVKNEPGEKFCYLFGRLNQNQILALVACHRCNRTRWMTNEFLMDTHKYLKMYGYL